MARPLVPTLLIALTACGPAPDPQAAAKAKAQQDAVASDDMGKQVDTAIANENWSLARAQCDVLGFQFPQSAAATRLKDACANAKSRANAQAALARLQGLWSYQTQPVGKGRQLNASIYSKNAVDTGAGQTHVRLVFRDHPAWKRSSYLVLENGDFDCYGGCQLKVDVDGKPRTMAGSRPKTDEAIAMFVEDERGLWRIARKAKVLMIRVPLKGAKAQDAVFEVGGLDGTRMPGW